mmetsp:Transcript_84379/g.145887  ORF Transcript_84379/g.145887 Transcript_84379/m.145887 type:complete len:195 (+) Transcript_84379:31-615(+)
MHGGSVSVNSAWAHIKAVKGQMPSQSTDMEGLHHKSPSDRPSELSELDITSFGQRGVPMKKTSQLLLAMPTFEGLGGARPESCNSVKMRLGSTTLGSTVDGVHTPIAAARGVAVIAPTSHALPAARHGTLPGPGGELDGRKGLIGRGGGLACRGVQFAGCASRLPCRCEGVTLRLLPGSRSSDASKPSAHVSYR